MAAKVSVDWRTGVRYCCHSLGPAPALAPAPAVKHSRPGSSRRTPRGDSPAPCELHTGSGSPAGWAGPGRCVRPGRAAGQPGRPTALSSSMAGRSPRPSAALPSRPQGRSRAGGTLRCSSTGVRRSWFVGAGTSLQPVSQGSAGGAGKYEGSGLCSPLQRQRWSWFKRTVQLYSGEWKKCFSSDSSPPAYSLPLLTQEITYQHTCLLLAL